LSLVATEYLFLDGFFHEPGQWSRPFFSDQATQFTGAELPTSDAQFERIAHREFSVQVAT
jgi:hypothetical protein